GPARTIGYVADPNPLRALPAVHEILERLAPALSRFPRTLIVSEIRRALDEARRGINAPPTDQSPTHYHLTHSLSPLPPPSRPPPTSRQPPPAFTSSPTSPPPRSVRRPSFPATPIWSTTSLPAVAENVTSTPACSLSGSSARRQLQSITMRPLFILLSTNWLR